MHHYQTVLVAVDFSQHSEKAIARAKQLAAMYEAELQLLHVIEEPMYPIYDDISLSATPNDVGKPSKGSYRKADAFSRNKPNSNDGLPYFNRFS